MSRFVLLRHECSGDRPRTSHWDLMLEREGVLWTWALDRLPGSWAALFGVNQEPHAATDIPLTAERLGDHRLAYLDYEGSVSGGRGSVRRCGRGECDWVVVSTDHIAVQLGEPLNGILTRGLIPTRLPTRRLRTRNKSR